MKYSILVILYIFSLIGCSPVNDEDVVVVFKGEKINTAEFKKKYFIWLKNVGQKDEEGMRKTYLYNWLSDEIMYETGLREGLEYLPDIAQKLRAYKKQLIIDKMKHQMRSELYSISDDEIKKYYHDNKKEFVRDKLYRIYAVRLKSMKKAQKVLQKLNDNSESIRMLSARFSDDRQLAINNGDWGLFSEDIMDPRWKEQLKAARLGEILGPIADSDGYYVVMELSGFAYKREISFKRAYPLIVKKMIAMQGADKWLKLQNNMIRNYGVKVNLKNLKWE